MKKLSCAIICILILAIQCDAWYSYTANTNNGQNFNIEKLGSSKVEDLTAACDQMGSDCVGFDTYGYLKNSTSGLQTDPDSSFYTKMPGNGPDVLPKRPWPLPQQYTYGTSIVYLQTPFHFKANVSSAILERAFTRYHELIFSRDYETSNAPQVVDVIEVRVGSTNDTLQLGIDESYSLQIGAKIILEAKTIYGAMHGLETFSQLVEYDFDGMIYVIKKAPWTINDWPMFPHRGVLIDTSRHFLPVKTIKRVIESLSYAKLNVLHWHAVDGQSFPLEVQSYPGLWKGAWSPHERYSQKQIRDIVTFAQDRGVRVMIEFDGPGHMYSWGTGYPDLWPQGFAENPNCDSTCPVNPCDVPVDPSSPEIMPLLEGVLKEMTGPDGLFTETLVHLGGDEVEYACWSQSPRIQQYMKQNNMSSYDQLYEYYITQAHNFANSFGKVPVNWEEVFNHFGTQLSPDTIIHIWLDHATLARVVEAGYRGILSNQNDWYLDHLDTDWTTFYLNDPLENITTKQELVIGGETCMWGESADPSDVFTRIWPKSAASAEVLWNYQVARNVYAVDLAIPRLHHFRCHLLDRDIDSAPINSYSPNQPGSCYAS